VKPVFCTVYVCLYYYVTDLCAMDSTSRCSVAESMKNNSENVLSSSFHYILYYLFTYTCLFLCFSVEMFTHGSYLKQTSVMDLLLMIIIDISVKNVEFYADY